MLSIVPPPITSPDTSQIFTAINDGFGASREKKVFGAVGLVPAVSLIGIGLRAVSNGVSQHNVLEFSYGISSISLGVVCGSFFLKHLCCDGEIECLPYNYRAVGVVGSFIGAGAASVMLTFALRAIRV